jgi:acetylornithine deacetylase
MRISALVGSLLPVWVAAQNLSLQHPELFSLHWRMLEQNSTSGFETPMVDFLSGYLEDRGLTVELQPVQNPILA